MRKAIDRGVCLIAEVLRSCELRLSGWFQTTWTIEYSLNVFVQFIADAKVKSTKFTLSEKQQQQRPQRW